MLQRVELEIEDNCTKQERTVIFISSYFYSFSFFLFAFVSYMVALKISQLKHEEIPFPTNKNKILMFEHLVRFWEMGQVKNFSEFLFSLFSLFYCYWSDW